MEREQSNLYRRLPQLGEFLDGPVGKILLGTYPRELVVEAARHVISRLRDFVKSGTMTEEMMEQNLEHLAETIVATLRNGMEPSLRPVINATGVLLHTNLGRSPLSTAAIRRIEEVARGYCNLEMDLATGERSPREAHCGELLLRVFAVRGGMAAEDFLESHATLVVNNCAAATLLALNSLAEDGEVIVSRGELVEIGGGFRIPEILKKSGATLREVGTTNCSRVADYAAAIVPQTKLILRVHRSNFSITGYTDRPTLKELVMLGAEASVPIFEDQGTGCLASLSDYGIDGEPTWMESVTGGAALVACSGDKLLGGPQCGILVGQRGIIETIRNNPLYRALRVDKLTYAGLEATLLNYLRGEQEQIPAVAMLAMSEATIQDRCEKWVRELDSGSLQAEVVPTRSMVGGGTTPGASLPSFAVALHHAKFGEAELAARLRRLDPPIIARTTDGRVLLDLRTVPPEQDTFLVRLLRENLRGKEQLQEMEPNVEVNL